MSWLWGLHLAYFPMATPSHPCLSGRLYSSGRWPPHPALKWKAIITAFPRTFPLPSYPRGTLGLHQVSQDTWKIQLTLSLFANKFSMTAVGGGDRPRASDPLRGHFPACLRHIPGQDPVTSHLVPLGLVWTVPASCSGGSFGAEDAC